jgi:uncharacterized protein YyaL (SSP411 family)
MLYDNAQLAVVYLEAWQHTGDSEYRRIAREILDYVRREMTSPEGGFYSASDADSPTPGGHDEEGWFFTWAQDELERVLGPDDSAIISSAYGVTKEGNFEGRNILHRVKDEREVASELRISPRRVAEVVANARSRLYEARALRPPPSRDEKILAAWNGMMISAFARAGWALDDADYVGTALRAARFVLDSMRTPDGILVRTYRGGKKAPGSFLDDYAFMVGACLDLYEATGDLAWLRHAIELQSDQDARHLDTTHGGYYLTPNDGEALLAREKPSYDHAVPSENSASARNLLRLHDLTGDAKWLRTAERVFAALAFPVTRSPIDYPLLLVALDHYYDLPLEVAIIAPRDRQETRLLAERLRSTFVPNKSFVALTEAEAVAQQAMIPWLEGKQALQDRSAAYVCERGRCDLPTSSPAVFQRQIERYKPYPSFETERLPRLRFEGESR